jgi:hypothetical protein
MGVHSTEARTGAMRQQGSSGYVIVRRILLTAAVCLMSTPFVSPAHAAVLPTWLAPVNISSPSRGFFFDPQVAVDAHGEAVAVWGRWDPVRASNVVEASARVPGAEWQSPVDLSLSGEEASAPRVAIDAQGDAVVVWRQSNADSGQSAESAFRPAGGNWQGPDQVSGASAGALDVSAAISARGEAVAVWDSGGVVQTATRAPDGGWQAPVDVSAAGETALVPEVVMDSRGATVVVWQGEGLGGSVQAAARAPSGAWQSTATISGRGTSEPHVGIDEDGEAVAVWEVNSGFVQAATLPAEGVWEAPVRLSRAAQVAAYSQVAMDARGDAVAIWYDESQGPHMTGEGYVVESAERPAGGAWQSPVAISAPAGGQGGRVLWSPPEIAMDPLGGSVAVWSQSNGSNYIVQGAIRSAGEPWQPAVALSSGSGNGGDAQVALDPSGNALAVWDSSYGGEEDLVQAAVYEAAEPLGNSTSTSGSLGGAPATMSPSDAATRQAATAPTLTDARVIHRWLGPGHAPLVAAKTQGRLEPVAGFGFTLSEAAKLTITLERVVSGQRRGSLCVAPALRTSYGRDARCARVVPVGKLGSIEQAGTDDSVALSGRLGSRRLASGSYDAVLVASSAAGASRPVTLRFTVAH